MKDKTCSRRLSIVIVSYNTRAHLERCLTSLRENPPLIDHEIIVIDNASSDDSDAMVQSSFPEVRLLRSPENEGYGRAVNCAVRESSGNLIALLNPDIEVLPGALQQLVEFQQRHPRLAVVGPRLILSSGGPQASARRDPSPALLLLEASRLHKLLPNHWRSRLFLGTYFAQNETLPVPWVSGACHLIPREAWERVGPLTEETFCGFDDYDYCYRARRLGYQVWLCAEASMIHHCSVAVKQRWKEFEIEALSIHNSYVVLLDRWPRWRVFSLAVSECLVWGAEALRLRLARSLRSEPDGRGDQDLALTEQRLRLPLRFLLGREQPRRRFQPGVRPLTGPS